MKKIQNLSFDEERAFYGKKNLDLHNCKNQGKADGESAFKECENIKATQCLFDLRYPFWHTKKISLKNCELSYSCRAPLWYSQNINIQQSKVYAVKAVRECSNVSFDGCDIRSPECFWFSKNISVKNSKMQGEYFMFKSSKGVFENLDFQGKYSFQYTKNLSFNNCVFFTKDAFWHAENVVVKNSVVTGEYLGWYSKNLTLENCEIRGTQPFCYCENLTLKNCKMIGCDLAFEKSSVKATITTKVDSIKNPKSGKITLPEVGEIILDDKGAKGKIEIKK